MDVHGLNQNLHSLFITTAQDYKNTNKNLLQFLKLLKSYIGSLAHLRFDVRNLRLVNQLLAHSSNHIHTPTFAAIEKR